MNLFSIMWHIALAYIFIYSFIAVGKLIYLMIQLKKVKKRKIDITVNVNVNGDSMDQEEMIPARSGGNIRDIAPGRTKPNIVFLYGTPQRQVPIYEKFVEAGTDPSLLQRYHNVITGISILLADDTNWPPACCWTYNCPWTGSETYGLRAKIKYIGFLDDKIHLPEEFVAD